MSSGPFTVFLVVPRCALVLLHRSRQAAAAVNLQYARAGAGWGCLEMQRYPHGARSRGVALGSEARKRCGAWTKTCGAWTRICGADIVYKTDVK